MSRSPTRTRLACLQSALADLPRVSLPVDVTDETQFPELAMARRHLAALPAERRAQLEKEWNDD